MQIEGPKSTVVLIGVDEDHQVTLLEGNHRFVSCLLLPRELTLRRLRLMCGFSPRMERCCWYKTDLTNLFNYTKNRIKHFWSRDADLSELVLAVRASGDARDYADVVSFPNVKSE